MAFAAYLFKTPGIGGLIVVILYIIVAICYGRVIYRIARQK